ncbi:hypothetical protein O181_108721 [Austropuccinia psidii MF-1]|uniref:Uncharacterized protein n=1 Tax=Austropuccinia psidii MF-1 TaxID=1389203 RepID=A0A9Q3JVU6_9BASI|nr:hypothetical protein [Austropuccinia psidii MF-1]
MSNPYNHTARGAPAQDTLARTPLWSTMMKAFPSWNGCRDRKQADRNNSGQLALSPQDGNGKRTFKLGLIVTHGIQTQNQNPPNPLQQDSPVGDMPWEQSLLQATPGLSGSQWLEELFPKPSQHDEPPIPGPSQPSEPHEYPLTGEPELELDPMQSMEEPFDCPAKTTSVIIIDNMPVGSPLPFLLLWRSLLFTPRTQPPRPLNPTMRLCRN